jgi:hypothetical protein
VRERREGGPEEYCGNVKEKVVNGEIKVFEK